MRHRRHGRTRAVIRRESRSSALPWRAAPVALVVVALVAGTAVGARTVGTTTASFQTASYLRADPVTSQFDVGLRLPGDGVVHQVGPRGTALEVTASPGTEGTFVPGATARLDVEVFNNSGAIPASVSVDLGAAADVPSVQDSLRVSGLVTLDSGETVVLFGTPEDPAASEATLEDARAWAVTLTPRGVQPLDDGEAWVPGSAGSAAEVSIWWHLPEEPGLDVSGAVVDLVARFGGVAT